jgi:transposase
MDECHFQQHGSRCVMWIPPEDKDPVTKHAPTRKSIAMFGAVNLRTGKLVTMMANPFDAMTFKEFLKKLLPHRSKSRKMVVILDNARYHHASINRSFVFNNRKCLRLDYLPPYSPELNPIERVWKLVRKTCTHNQYFESLDSLLTAVSSQVLIWNKPNPVLTKLCCVN